MGDFFMAQSSQRKEPPQIPGRFTPDPVIAFDLHPKVAQFRPASMGNARLLAQRGVFLFTNTASPESMIRFFQDKEKKNLIEIVDLHPSMAREAIADLRRMGTTAASLFPGLDGVAQALKHELFFAS
ncbi:MAG: hypothetical protein AB7P37_20015 [Ramlibacter sp.]